MPPHVAQPDVPFDAIADAITQLREQDEQALLPNKDPDELTPLPHDWLFQRPKDDGPWPLWMSVCRAVMLAHGTVPSIGDAKSLRAHLTSERLRVDVYWNPSEWGPASTTHPALTPRRVAELAAYGLQISEGVSAATLKGFAPTCLQEDLLRAAFNAGSLPRAGLSIVQPVVSAWLHHHGHGALAELQLWRHDDAPARWPADAGRLVRAPGAALLPIDAECARGLARVQAVLDRVLMPGAPAVSWCLRPLKELGDQNPPKPWPALLGASATATLALGALVLLRDHVRSDTLALAELKAELVHCQPARAVISAGLGAWPAEGEASVWPPLEIVKGATDKLGVTLNLSPLYDLRLHCFARDQPGVGVLPSHQVADLGALVQRVADATGDLSEDARRLYAELVSPDLDPSRLDAKRLERVAADTAPRSIRGYLLWRYAVHAAGEHQPMGPPVRLHHHFVHLHLRDLQAEPGAKAEDAPPLNRDDDPAIRRDIQALLQGEEFSSVSAWCIEAAPYSGKTTMLCEWEMRSARQALQREHEREGHWGEVGLLLPLNQLAGKLHGDKVPFDDALLAWMQAQAPGLPPLRELFTGGPGTPDLQLRCLFDALDELQAPTPEARRKIERDLCTWLAAPGRRQMLAPVFTVREQEKAGSLDVGHWRPRRVALLPWRPSDMRAYLLERLGEPLPAGLPHRAPPAGSAAAQLLKVLGFSPTDDDPVLNAQPLNSMASFCATPGILAAQCTLIEAWPKRELPERRPDLLLALVWHRLDRVQHREELKDDALLTEDVRQLLADLASMDDWRLPAQPGALLALLARAADAMQDAHGGRATVVPLQPLLETLAALPLAVQHGGLPFVMKTWWAAVRATGLAYRVIDPSNKEAMFRFVHPQFQELFAALGLDRERLPDLEPPTLDPPTEQALAERLKEYGDRFDLPAVTPHHERVRMAVVVALPKEREAWLRRLLRSGNLAMAAQAAIDVKPALERHLPYPGGGRDQPNRLLQHLRRVLLLRSMDAGRAVHARLRAGCVIGDDERGAALAEQMPLHMGDVDDELEAHWQAEWQVFQRGEGRDIRHRLQAGVLLGELRDNLRYEFREGVMPEGRRLAGVCPKPEQWLWRGQPGGPALSYRIGDDDGGESERPAWAVDLPPFQIARYPVTVDEWAHFIACGGYDPQAPWWEAAGSAAREWLAKAGGISRRAEVWADPDFSQPLQPVVGLTVFDAHGYAGWADALDSLAHHEAASRLPVAVPPEVYWEAGVRGPLTDPVGRQGRRPHRAGAVSPGPLDFNHNRHLGRPSPVGSFVAGATPAGVFDALGNVEEWCASPLGYAQRGRGYRERRDMMLAQQVTDPADDRTYRALRGGGWSATADRCRAAYRDQRHPLPENNFVGLRLVRCVLPHSGR